MRECEIVDGLSTSIKICHSERFGHVEVSGVSLDRWLVLRVGGPHPQIGLFDRHDEGTWRATFRLCRPGMYTLHVRALLRVPWLSWQQDQWIRINASTPACPSTWASGVLLRHAIRFDGHSAGSDGDGVDGKCNAGLWSWYGEGTNASAAGRLLETITPAPHPNASHLNSLFGGRLLRFVEPEGHRAVHATASTPLHPRSPLSQLTSPPSSSPSTPTAHSSGSGGGETNGSLRVCLLGDSQVRTLTDGMVQLMAEGGQLADRCGCKPPRSSACPKNPTGSQTCTRPLCPSLRLTASYTRASFGTELFAPWPSAGQQPMSEALASRCAVLLVNFGQWWAASKPKPSLPHEGRTPGSYAREVEPTMLRLANISRDWGLPIAWVATNPYPINAGGPAYFGARARVYDMSQCSPTEKRFPHVLRAYNDAARRIAAAHGLTYLDTWQMALPLLDLSHDGAHYTFDGSPVGRPQAAMALNWALSHVGGAAGSRMDRGKSGAAAATPAGAAGTTTTAHPSARECLARVLPLQ